MIWASSGHTDARPGSAVVRLLVPNPNVCMSAFFRLPFVIDNQALFRSDGSQSYRGQSIVSQRDEGVPTASSPGRKARSPKRDTKQNQWHGGKSQRIQGLHRK
jgi:hypothetical protein